MLITTSDDWTSASTTVISDFPINAGTNHAITKLFNETADNLLIASGNTLYQIDSYARHVGR